MFLAQKNAKNPNLKSKLSFVHWPARQNDLSAKVSAALFRRCKEAPAVRRRVARFQYKLQIWISLVFLRHRHILKLELTEKSFC